MTYASCGDQIREEYLAKKLEFICSMKRETPFNWMIVVYSVIGALILLACIVGCFVLTVK